MSDFIPKPPRRPAPRPQGGAPPGPPRKSRVAETEGMPDFATQQELYTYIGKLETDMREAAELHGTAKELRTKEFLFS